ncbi:MAG: diguanylate cyclase [Armatimonadetes bacterium]|nr:diguanylate cyclase [Armatimonadota bacterium]
MTEPELRVLLVEDDPDHGELTAEALAAAGFDCQRVADEAACLQALSEQGPFDVLLLDYTLPGTTGLELLAAVREAGFDLPAIMLTGSGNERVAASAVRAGIADYLIKEPDLSHLRILPDALRRVVRAAGGRAGGNQTAPSPGADAELRHLLLTDPLTGLYNRRFLLDALRREFEAALRYHYALSCAMIDLDHFKAINDRYGHLVGDQVLTGFARIIRTNFRAPDLCFRYGGEEFTVLMPHTGVEEARAACERVLAYLRDHPFSTPAGQICVSASAGVATCINGNYMGAEELLAAADAALYAAKRNGRDRVVVASGVHDPANAMPAVVVRPQSKAA